MKNVLIFSLIFFVNVSLLAQTPIISFQKSYGGSLYEDGIDVVSLANGDFVVCGTSFSDISGDKTTNNFGADDYWVFQINSSGTILWQTTIGGSKSDIPSAIIQTTDGGFMILGLSFSPVSGNKTSINYGQTDAWLVKLNSTGQLQWEKSYGGTSFDSGVDLVPLANGNYFLGNSSMSGMTGNKTVVSKGGEDYWSVVIDDNGNIVDQFVFGGSGNDRLRDLVLIGSNQLLLSGISNSSISGDKNQNSYGNYDFWIVKSDLNGNIISSTTEGGSEYDILVNAVVNNDKSIMVFGNSDSDPTGSKTSLNYGYNDYWVVDLDSNLNRVNDYSFGGNNGDQGIFQRLGVFYSATNEYVLAGESYSDISGNKLKPSFNTSSGDIWVIGMDKNGGKTFEFVAGGTEGDQPRSIIETVNNTICIVGTSGSGISGNKTDTTKGTTDIWLIELDFNVSVKTIVNNRQLKTYPNPTQTVLNFSLPTLVNQSQISLTDVTGKVVYTQQLEKVNKHQIDVTSLPQGIYVLSVISEEFHYTRKVIIQ